jgi:hypothetical protein
MPSLKARRWDWRSLKHFLPGRNTAFRPVGGPVKHFVQPHACLRASD